MKKLQLSLIASANERTEPLLDGRVEADGLDLICVKRHQVADLFSRQLAHREFDIAEFSVNTFWMARTRIDFPFLAIPVFPQAGWFFHTRIRCHKESGIRAPADLRGKRFGMPRYAMDLMLWIRGVLQHEFGVAPQEIEWFAERQMGRGADATLSYRAPPNVKQIPPDQSAASMLVRRDLDASFPYPSGLRSSFERSTEEELQTAPGVERLFADPIGESIRYYRKTGLFHLNHLVIVREEILRQHPWVALSLFEAFQRSKELGRERTVREASIPSTLLWADVVLERATEVFGRNPFPYGFRANERALRTHAGYAFEQGLIARPVEMEALFAKNTLDF